MPLKARVTNAVGRIVAESRSGNRGYHQHDALGSTAALINSTGTVTDTYAYWPYGDVRVSSGSTVNPFKYCGAWGYYADTSGRTYVRARSLRPSLATWMSVDGLWPRLPAYTYGSSSPAVNIDPSGLADMRWTDPGSKCPYIRTTWGLPCCIKAVKVGGVLGIGEHTEFVPWNWESSQTGCMLPPKQCDNCVANAFPKGDGTLAKFCKRVYSHLSRMPEMCSFSEFLCINAVRLDLDKEFQKRCGHLDLDIRDKCLHCIASCNIAYFCGERAARWAGWCKEYRELGDCDPFAGDGDPLDDRANEDGIKAAPNCARGCRAYGAR